ncbi:MAG TPA: nicotinate-nucleotide diphosphorylase (carboxylating), partial [Planctomycetia bacterium]|nr:nicotinate-nucleotide diphosphorylase (carboxylating) [Planctomycetia bacterium]
VLIKDNHLAGLATTSARPVAEAIERARKAAPAGTIVEVEVDGLEQLREALAAGPDIVLLDNMTTGMLTDAVALRDTLAPEVLLEASGGVRRDTVKAIAATGVDRISAGALTHSAPALDLGLDFEGK